MKLHLPPAYERNRDAKAAIGTPIIKQEHARRDEAANKIIRLFKNLTYTDLYNLKDDVQPILGCLLEEEGILKIPKCEILLNKVEPTKIYL